MAPESETVRINATLELSARALTAIVRQSRSVSGPGGKPVDPADLVGIMISLFLAEKDFAAYADAPENYPVSMDHDE